jgi:hypothetical protein
MESSKMTARSSRLSAFAFLLVITILLRASCFFFPGDPAFKVIATNKTDSEIVIYLGVYPPQEEPSEFIEYYYVGTAAPGNAVSNDFAIEVGGPAIFRFIGERKTGQEIYYLPTILPWSVLESENIIYNQKFTRQEFNRKSHRVIIT